MRIETADARPRPLRVAGLVVLLLGAALLSSVARPSLAADDKKDAKKDDKKAEPTNPWAVKKYKFTMDGKPWDKVFASLTELTGKVVVSSYKPSGSLTLVTPADGLYSIYDLIDLINEGLLSNENTQKYILINRDRSFTLVPASEKIDPVLVDRIPIEDLDKRGENELVSTVLTLKALVAEDIAVSVKKIMGPFGDVVAFAEANQLILLDTVKNLKRVRDTIKKLEADESETASSYKHDCKYVKARDAERVLKELLGDPKALLTASSTDRGTDRRDPFNRDPNQDRRDPFARDGQDRRDTRQPAVILPKLRMYYISVDDRLNSVLVTGPANKIAQATKILKDLDVPTRDGQKPYLKGDPELKTFSVPTGNAEALAKVLQEAYKANPSVRITAAGNTSIIVYAGPEELIDITKKILVNTDKGVKTVSLDAGSLDVDKAAGLLVKLYGDPKTGAPVIEPHADTNTILVRGSAEQITDVKRSLKAMQGESVDGVGADDGSTTGTMRVITLEKGSAAILAEELQRMMSKMRQNPVEVIKPGPQEKKEEKKEEKPMPKPDDENEVKPMSKVSVEVPISYHADDGQLVDPQEKKKEEDKSKLPGDKNKPVKITAQGNKLIITSDDPKALALATQLIRVLTTSAGEGDFHIIRLKNANASEAARILDEAFNGPKQPTQQANPFSRFSGFGAQMPTNPTPNRVRVVADPATNSLLVRATPLDMLTIEALVSRAIDTGEAGGLMNTYIVGPLKYATASEVASVVKDVFHQLMDQNVSPSSIRGFSGAIAASTNRNTNPDGTPRAVRLTVSVDDRTNSIVLNTTEAIRKDVEILIKKLDEAAKDSQKTVMVVPLKDVDLYSIEQAVYAFQGRRSPFRQGMQGQQGFGGPGGFGGQPSGIGGFGPGGPGRGFGGPSGFGQGAPGGFQGGFGGPSGFGGPGGFSPGGFGPGAGGPGTGGPGMGGPGNRGSGGGGGGRTRGGSGMSSMAERRGPDFFEQGDMDVPELALYDPQLDHRTSDLTPTYSTLQPEAPVAQSDRVSGQLQLARLQEQPEPKPGQAQVIVGPRGPVEAIALDDLGIIIVSGNNPSDVKAAIEIIKYLANASKGSAVKIEMVTLEEGDATAIVNQLNLIYQRVNVTPNGNSPTLITPRTLQSQSQFAGAVTQSTTQAPSVMFLPIVRFNAIMVGAPESQLPELKARIKELDKRPSPQMQAKPIRLAKESASHAAQLITNFWNSRYPQEGANQHQVRITWDDSTNTVFVQASPGDLADIEDMLHFLDTHQSAVTNDVIVVPLQNALSDDMAALLTKAITDGVAPPSTGAPGVVPGTLGTGPGATPAAPAATRPPGSVQIGQTKSTSLRFISRADGRAVESGLLEDVHITSDPRTNSLLISAPKDTIQLLLAMIHELDSSVRAEVKVFELKKADAYSMANMLQQLFLGAGGIGTQRPPTLATSTGGGGPTGPSGATTPAGTTTSRPILLTLGGEVPGGPPLIELHVTIDDRTNSLVVAGSRNDLSIIESIIYRLEDAVVEPRHNEVVHLRNATATDLANALNSFLVTALAVYRNANQLTGFQDLMREVIVVPEPITNKLLISATPRFYPDVMRLIAELDADQPQVMIQVLVAEVDLSGDEEFGVDIGLQSPIMFQRGLIYPNTSQTYTSATTAALGGPSVIPAGLTVNATQPAVAYPGFNFNQPTLGLPNNNPASPNVVGFQQLGNLGVGTISPTAGVSGMVLSAASQSFNILIRALKTQGRIDILSRPQVMTLDNQSASILIGQSVPYASTSNVTTGVVSTGVTYRNVGVELLVTPRISPDGKVLMRVEPTISSLGQQISVGNGTTAPVFNVQDIQTTVVAGDGETVAIGGLIQKKDTKQENKYPWLGDLPVVGAAFRYRSQVKSKQELLVILTPHIVHNRKEADQVMAEEGRRMDWVVGDIMRTHGTTGMEPLFPQPNMADGPGHGANGHLMFDSCAPGASGPDVHGAPLPAPSSEPQLPKPTPGATSAPTPPAPAPTTAAPAPVSPPAPILPEAPPTTSGQPSTSAPPMGQRPITTLKPATSVATRPAPAQPVPTTADTAPPVPVHYNPVQPMMETPPTPSIPTLAPLSQH
jgi:type II secretion system protein D